MDDELIALRFWEKLVSVHHPITVVLVGKITITGFLIACKEDMQEIIIAINSLEESNQQLILLKDVIEIHFDHVQRVLHGIITSKFVSCL
jgi:recombinational DNA repair protein RecR